MSPRLKFCIYQYYFYIVLGLLVIAGGVIAFFWNKVNDIETLFTIFVGLFSFIFLTQKQQLEELRTFRELFSELNSRYDKLDVRLNRIAARDDNDHPLTKFEIDTLYKYFNLCGEEYLYYRKGYIYPQVWEAWCNGMAFFLRNKRIEKLWTDEEGQEYYYGLTLAEIRKNATRTHST